MSENPRLTPTTKTKVNHAWVKSLLPIKLKSNTNKKVLDINKFTNSRANTHLNGALRVRIKCSENPRVTPPPKTKFNHFWGTSVLPIKLKSNTTKKVLDMNKVRNIRLILI